MTIEKTARYYAHGWDPAEGRVYFFEEMEDGLGFHADYQRATAWPDRAAAETVVREHLDVLKERFETIRVFGIISEHLIA